MTNEMTSEINHLFWLSYVVSLLFLFHLFSPFNCCLSVVLRLHKGGYPPTFSDCGFVLINAVLLNLSRIWILS